jgi:nucleotide-binding universal stress UspA family protein
LEPIVVGVDGSAGSVAALRWALAEAHLRGAPLRLVHAYNLPHYLVGDVGVGLGAAGVPAYASEDAERLRAASEDEARRVLTSTLEGADGETLAGVEVEQEIVEGRAAQVLIEAARGAALLVVGSRGRGGFAGLLLGSVSQQCAQHPPCPLVILPPVEEDEAAEGG